MRRTTVRKRRPAGRRGATVLEMAIILALFLVASTAMLDLGIAVFRQHLVNTAARRGARLAIVHGSMAEVLGPWGPSSIDVPLTSNGTPIVGGDFDGDGKIDGVQPLMVGCDLSRSRIRVEWVSGSNDPGKVVSVRVTTPYQPVLSFVFGSDEVILSATSNMYIMH